jgi:hypothetical protein
VKKIEIRSKNEEKGRQKREKILFLVIPAKAGIQGEARNQKIKQWLFN